MRKAGRSERRADPPEAEGHGRLIVVSNREPYEHKRRKGHLVCQRTDGGLTSALDPVLRRLHGIWVAWGSGEADREATGPGDVLDVPPGAPVYQLRRVWLSSDEIKDGYQGYANEVLWPLCHITLDRISYHKRFWEAYAALNARFAGAVLEEIHARPGAVWVHDFHLALLPRLIKQDSPMVTVALFWHIPWPGIDVFRILPERKDILSALLATDSLVFQTNGYRRAFADCAAEFVGATVDPTGQTIEYKGHTTRLTARAISVDYDTFSTGAATAQVSQLMASTRRRLRACPGVRFGLGVDRLDYTKGLLKRFWALDDFFTRYPQYHGHFTFIQIAVPTRSEVETYRRYRKAIWQTVFDINNRHGIGQGDAGAAWRPIELLENRIGFAQLTAYYRLADVALVSSVNDGMNLVAKEYVAAQVDETGVLLISQMAGAADELTEAVVINPYDPEGLADSLKRALEMSSDERRRRMHALREYLKTHDIHHWVSDCLHDAGIAEAYARPIGKQAR